MALFGNHNNPQPDHTAVWPLLGVTSNAALGGNQGGAAATTGFEETQNGLYPIIENIGAAAGQLEDRKGSVPEMFQTDFRVRAQLEPLMKTLPNGATYALVWDNLPQETRAAFIQCLALKLAIQAADTVQKEYTIAQIEQIGTPYTNALAQQLQKKGLTGLRLYSSSTAVLGYERMQDGYPEPLIFGLSVCPAARLYQPFGRPADNLIARLYAPSTFMLPVDLGDFPLPEPSADNAKYYVDLCGHLEDMLANLSSIVKTADGTGTQFSYALRDIDQKLRVLGDNCRNKKDLAVLLALVDSWLLPVVTKADVAAFGHTVYSPNNETAYVLPLTEKFFEDWNDAGQYDYAHMIAMLSTFRFTEENSNVRVEFMYGGRVISKLLPYQQKVCAPAMVWPPKPSDNWSKYYLYSDLDGSVDTAGRLNSSHMKLAAHGVSPCAQRIATIDGDNRGEVSELGGFPAVFTVQGSEGLLLGFVVNALPPAQIIGNRTGIVSIDFGSTNSTVFCRSAEGGEPEPLTLCKGVYTVCGKADEVRTLLNFHFNDHHQEEIPPIFLTLVNDHRKDLNTAHLGLATCSIPFIKTLTPDTTKPLFSRLRQDLKFNQDGALPIAVRLNCRAFFEQLVTEIRWALLEHGFDTNQVKYYYSVPSSMGEDARANIKAILSTILANYDQTFSTEKRDMYESEAVGTFVTKRIFAGAGFTQSGYACIDIGGGSIDISIWQQPSAKEQCRLIDETSMNMIAGKGILMWMMRCAKNNLLDMMKRCFMTFQKELIQRGIGNDMVDYLDRMMEAVNANDVHQFNTYYGARADQLSTLFKRAYAENLDTKDTNALARFRRGLELYFCLLMYFVGEMTGDAIVNKKMKTWPSDSAKKFTICLAGNGSKFIDLVGGLDTLKEKMCACFLQGVTHLDKGEHGYVDIRDSGEYHKHEVAGGLCYQFGGNQTVEHQDDLPNLPVSFVGNGQNFPLKDFTKVFGSIREGMDSGNSVEICTRTDTKEGDNYNMRFRNMMYSVLTQCDLQ